MMLRIEDEPLALFLKNDFLSTWQGRVTPQRTRFGPIEMLSLDGRTNKAGFAPLFELIDNARHSIYVQSPYLTIPFTDHLRRAVKRGVRVTVVTPGRNNKPGMADYIAWEAARSGFELLCLTGRMTHLKAMLIDDSQLVVGSSNFDYFSYRFEREIVAIISEPSVIAEFIAKVVKIDQASCRPAIPPKNSFHGWTSILMMRTAGLVSSWFGR
jgi:cardiolipin synthase